MVCGVFGSGKLEVFPREEATFSFLFSLPMLCESALIELVLGSYLTPSFVDGAEKSEYTLGLGVALSDDDPLPAREGVCRDSRALLLLDRRLDLMNGNLSFIRSAVCNTEGGREINEELLGTDESRFVRGSTLEDGRDDTFRIVVTSLAIWWE